MKIKISKEKFLKALQIIQPIISSNPVKPILGNVLISAEKNKVDFVATDETMFIRHSVEAEVKDSGSSTFMARRILNLTRELPDSDISFSVDDKDVASIHCGASSSKLYGISSDEFPLFKEIVETIDITMDQTALKQMIQNTSYAAAVASDDSRHTLNGVLVSLREQKAVVVATDGRRLALMEQEIEIPSGKNVEMIVPNKTVGEWIRVLRNEGTVKMRASTSMVGIEFDDIKIYSNLIPGTYPNFRQVIPNRCEERVTVSREGLLASLRRVSAITDFGTFVKMDFDENELKVTGQSPDIGEAEDTLPIKYSGKKLSIAFNPYFIMDALRNLVCDEIYFELVDSLSPGVIKCDIPFLYVIMPQRIP